MWVERILKLLWSRTIVPLRCSNSVAVSDGARKARNRPAQSRTVNIARTIHRRNDDGRTLRCIPDRITGVETIVNRMSSEFGPATTLLDRSPRVRIGGRCTVSSPRRRLHQLPRHRGTGRTNSHSDALVIDLGSTTADIIPRSQRGPPPQRASPMRSVKPQVNSSTPASRAPQ